ncbi:aromatic ring-hydroxylating dioxygenase subunit alpha [Croceicoccus sp. BE223]|uniref:aromatic ring-hydroxylating oxygenase subunit alpha n=1 Tax=Croceicoccus sp. BE223 TaxID=2817716 RepID=UPI00285928E3|nr:aromatic ring-hydroxylating dioxygenase subunit alpha [Croceicoccus sp. BE223]MDR7102393.1 phenylpropionate dioxygenase-like ring-hydroxylating dioxygenase large terminal subunit [Croceicoccus sp. BE223]
MTDEAKTHEKPGEARCPGVSVQDILANDSRCVPRYLTEQSYEFLGDEDIPVERYISQEFFDREIKDMWPRVWQWACREEHIPEDGDYIVYDFGPYSVLVVRTEDGAIKAYRNACMHRGTMLKPRESEGSADIIRCPYHGWQWNLDGTLKSLPCEWDFPHVRKADYALKSVRCEMWGGFVFVNLDDEAEPLLEYLAPLPDHLESDVFANRYVAMHVQKELNCNWKIASEAFLEAYHVMETHPQLMRTNGDANTQYDFYGDNVSRLINVAGSPSALLDEVPSEQEILDSFLMGDSGDVGEKLVVPEGSSARKIMAQFFRDTSRAKGMRNLDETSDSEIVDSIAYLAFPNQQFFSGVAFPIVYRFRPLGMSVNRSLFDLVILKQRPTDGSKWETAEPYRLRSEESYTTVPGIDPYIGNVYDQDTGNMEAAQLGCATLGRDGVTLANYQEIRIRHMHRTLMKYLDRKAGSN